MLGVVRHLSAQLMSYCFLENCDSRMAVCDTGPYRLADGRFVALREMCTDTGDFDWTTGIRDLIPHHNFVVAYAFGDDVEMETNLWGTGWFGGGPGRDRLGTVASRPAVLRPLGRQRLRPPTPRQCIRSRRSGQRVPADRIGPTDTDRHDMLAAVLPRSLHSGVHPPLYPG